MGNDFLLDRSQRRNGMRVHKVCNNSYNNFLSESYLKSRNDLQPNWVNMEMILEYTLSLRGNDFWEHWSLHLRSVYCSVHKSVQKHKELEILNHLLGLGTE